MKYGYVRVSTVDQNTDRQLSEQILDQVFTDKASGKNTERPQLKKLLSVVSAGDTVYVHSMDRLARNLSDLQSLVEEINGKGATIIFVKESLTFEADKEKQPLATLLLQLLGAVAQFERSLILERQREGIAKAKKRGVYKGRKPIDNKLLEDAAKAVGKDLSVTRAAKAFGVGKTTLYKFINSAKEHKTG